MTSSMQMRAPLHFHRQRYSVRDRAVVLVHCLTEQQRYQQIFQLDFAATISLTIAQIGPNS